MPASSFLKQIDNYKYDNICLAIPGSYVNGNLYYSGKLFSKSIWAFHTFKNVNNNFEFIGYLIVSNDGKLFSLFNASYISGNYFVPFEYV